MKYNTKLFVLAATSLLLTGCGTTPASSEGHTCHSVCTVCGGCLNASCSEEACANKCTCPVDYIDPFPSTPGQEKTIDVTDYTLGTAPYALNVTYYSDIYSRGFNWITTTEVNDTKLYVVESDKKENADFSSVEAITGTCMDAQIDKKGAFKTSSGMEGFADASGGGTSKDIELTANVHKAHIENLKPNTIYSYKLGAEDNWKYGTFRTEVSSPKSVRAIQLSDAQTKDGTKLEAWRNTFKQARITAGQDLDMVLYNGDQFDQNMATLSGKSNGENKLMRYGKALDVIEDYKTSIPYMASSGNHEPSLGYAQVLMSDINYAGFDRKGAYYSYDYNFAHFIVLNANRLEKSAGDQEKAQVEWLEQDLDEASKTAKWIVVVMHIAAYSTGDHSNDKDNQTIDTQIAPMFSKYHVDLVLQAHDHTYNKTLPYKWDAAGYTTTYGNAEVVNLTPETKEVEGTTYDLNPNGTYYVTTGAAGHRCGAAEADAGIWAEVKMDGSEMKPLDSSHTFTNNKYKVEVGKLTQANQYESWTHGSFTSSQDYKVGDPATGNVNANMFGVLDMTENTLSYKAYTVNGSTVKLFDTLNVLKEASN